MNPSVDPAVRDAVSCAEQTASESTLVGLLAARLAEAPDRLAVVTTEAGKRVAWTWREVAGAAIQAAVEMEGVGLERGDRVVHLGRHSPAWIITDLACHLAGFVHVPLHASAEARELREQIEWLNPRGIVFGDRGLEAALGVSGDRMHDRIVIKTPADSWRYGDRDEALDDSAAVAARLAATDPDAPATIVLSSGTTGVPHGVVHSQRTLAWNARAVSAVFLSDPRDIRLSWLPASHLYARVGDLYSALARGGCLHVVSDRTKVLEACREMPPTVILGVPAFFERLEAAARSGKIRDLATALGGEVRVCISGGAVLRERTAAYFQTHGVPLVEGYGLAEAGPVVAVATPRNTRPGTVGLPLPGVEIRIDDSAKSRGQLLVRTPSRALGVVVSATDDTTTLPEWLETGDTAEIDEAGHLRITGRIKDVIVLANGMKVPPAHVERAIAEDEAVAQVCVVGDGLRASVALVVPEPAAIRRALRQLGVMVFSRRAALAHPKLIAWMTRRLLRRQQRLPRSWHARHVVLVGRPFDAAHGEATESLKLRRSVIQLHFEKCVREKGVRNRFEKRSRAIAHQGSMEGIGAMGGMEGVNLLTTVWHGDDGGFAGAAEMALAPLASSVEAVVTRTAEEIARLRAVGQLYDLPDFVPPVPPIDDPPPAPRGRFSATAEAALGDAGLWGLAVPVAFGGAGASTVELARSITQFAADVPTAAGMLAVHSSIGAVTALAAFGTPEQQTRHLPGLARGRPLSIFGATEPDAGCDLGRVQSVIERQGERLVLTGTKMFITNAVHGRLVKLLAMHEGKPAVVLVRLPDADTPTFRLRHYAIHPLKHTANAALEFLQFEVDHRDVLRPPGNDRMAIVWHGLNRGRTTLAAQAAGTLRLLLGHAVDHAKHRMTWGRPIADRQLVQGRLGRIAASITACDAMSTWAAAAVDAGGGEQEAITAKIVASRCVREAAMDALGVHGGRAFLVGHPLGDAFHDHLAVGVYEGESDLLNLALFRGIAKGHPLATLGRDAGGLRRYGAWLAWRASVWLGMSKHCDEAILDRSLRAHARLARRLLATTAARIDAAIRMHGRNLAERQLDIGSLADDTRDLVSILAVAHHADARCDDRTTAAADCWCRAALARVTGRKLLPSDHVALAALGTATLEGPWR